MISCTDYKHERVICVNTYVNRLDGQITLVKTYATFAARQSCAPATCTGIPSCLTFYGSVLNGKGFEIRNRANVQVSTGVAYAIISHGENRVFSYSYRNGVSQSGTGGAQESNPNAGNLALQPYYVADVYTAQSSTLYFDDLVVFKSVQAQATAARLDARAH